jgi:hypothetical protein
MTINYGARTAKFISKLVQLTQEGKLRWITMYSSSATSYPKFKTQLHGRELELSCDAAQSVGGAGFINTYLGIPSRTVVLQIGAGVDAEATKLINAAGAGDLYDSVFRIVGGLDKLFDDVLK